MDPYAVLGGLVTDAPGRTASETALTLLRGLALGGDPAAADAISGALARDLGVPPDSALPQLYRAGCSPADFLDRAEEFADLSRELAASDLQPFQELVRRHAPLADEALRAYVLSGVIGSVGLTAVTGTALFRGAYRLHVMDQIHNELRIVPGDAADHSFEFGRDFLLRCNGTGALMGVILHELGHHIFESSVNSAEGIDAVLDHQLLSAVGAALPGLVSAAAERHDAFGPDDPRRAQCHGVTVLASRPSLPGGEYLHLSFSEDGGPISWSLALPVALWAAEVLRLNPADAAVARSPRGIFHLGLLISTTTQPDPGPEEELAERSSQWYDALLAAGRIGRVDVDIAVMLGLAEQPTRLHAAYQSAWQDHDMCDQLATGEFQIPPEHVHLLPALFAAAVRCGNPEAVAQLLKVRQPLITTPDDDPLVALGAGCCVLTRGPETVVRAAGAEELWLTVEAAAAAGVNLDQPATEDGQTLLTDAAARNETFVRRLLAAGADPDATNTDGESPLLVAARTQRVDSVAALIGAGVAVSAADPAGYTVLHHAASQDSPLDFLIGAGADPAARTQEGQTPLMMARSAAGASTLLTASGNDPDYIEAADLAGLTALTHAAARCDLEVVRSLLEAGADVHTATDQGFTPLHYAAHAPARLGACQILDLLREAGADINEEADDGTTPLMLSIRQNDSDVARWLIDAGADVDASDRHGITAVMIASDGQRPHPRGNMSFGIQSENCLRLLLESGADPNLQNDHGVSALIGASRGWDGSIVQILLEHGADPDLRSDDGETALQNARRADHAFMVDLLIAAGATA